MWERVRNFSPISSVLDFLVAHLMPLCNVYSQSLEIDEFVFAAIN